MVKIMHLLLAAGSSKRMEEPKQLLHWGNKTLIEHQIATLLETSHDIMVVLGANANKILPIIKKLPISIYLHKNWAEGMGSTIAYGISKISNEMPNIDGVLISLIDQPLVTKSHFRQLINSFQPSKKMIVASQSSEGWLGVPALFDASYFDELKTLKQDVGAKRIIQKHSNNVTSLNADNLLTDIDTPETYNNIVQTINPKI